MIGLANKHSPYFKDKDKILCFKMQYFSPPKIKSYVGGSGEDNQPTETTQVCNDAIRLSVIIDIFIWATNHTTTKFI